jgi:hypothetical protein
MSRFIFPLFLLALGIFGLVEHEAINQQWAAMYPSDPSLQAALTRCAEDNVLFNRFSADARAGCYQKYLQPELPGSAPGVTVSIPGHLVPHAPAVRTNTNR